MQSHTVLAMAVVVRTSTPSKKGGGRKRTQAPVNQSLTLQIDEDDFKSNFKAATDAMEADWRVAKRIKVLLDAGKLQGDAKRHVKEIVKKLSNGENTWHSVSKKNLDLICKILWPKFSENIAKAPWEKLSELLSFATWMRKGSHLPTKVVDLLISQTEWFYHSHCGAFLQEMPWGIENCNVGGSRISIKPCRDTFS